MAESSISTPVTRSSSISTPVTRPSSTSTSVTKSTPSKLVSPSMPETKVSNPLRLRKRRVT